jgi:hypothetical protein
VRIACERQQTEEWDRWRARPTASDFYRFVTPAKGQYSAQATAYAAVIVAKRLRVYVEPPPSFWMTWGIENEPSAKVAYTERTGRQIEEVGFVLPDDTDAFGCSPDGLVGTEGLLEVKCPAPETLICYHGNGELPDQYRPQIQGQLLITGRRWCDFWAWHPQVAPFLLRVDADPVYQDKILECLFQLLKEIKQIEERMAF